MADVTLRKATQADAAALGALHVASWHETYTGVIPDEMLAGLSVDARTAMWSKILGVRDEFGRAAVFVAEDNGRVIGFGACGWQREDALTNKGFSGEFGAIYVLRSHQRRGAGRSIIAAMSKELSAAGHTAACLWVLRQTRLRGPSTKSSAVLSWSKRSMKGPTRPLSGMPMAGATYRLWSANRIRGQRLRSRFWVDCCHHAAT